MTVDRCNYFFSLSFPSFQLIYFCFLPLSLFQYTKLFFLPFYSKTKRSLFLLLRILLHFLSTLFSSFYTLISRSKHLLLMLPAASTEGRMLLSLQTRTHTLQCTTSFIKNKPLTLPTPAKAKNSFAALLLLRYLSLLSSCFVDALSSRSWFGRCNNYDNNNNNIHNKTPTRNWFVCYFWLSFLSAFSLE